jgi:deoxyribodipyrimidine photo-lyase
MSAIDVVWFRRDLRVHDQATFLSSAPAALGVFVLDPALLTPSGAVRTHFLAECLRALDADLSGRLLVTAGDPVDVIPRIAALVGAGAVHIAADHGPYGTQRDAAVEAALKDVSLVRSGSPYAVAPGRLRTADGNRYRVFTPFHRAWVAHGWRAPAATDASTVDWLDPDGTQELTALRAALPDVDLTDVTLPPAGEAAALARWAEFLTADADEYASARNRPDLAATSRMSPYLKFGCVHPRTLLADLVAHGQSPADRFGAELAWRDFYADVLNQRPDSARHNYNRSFDALPVDTGIEADRLFAAWCEGRTGYPIVDAGMRQLLAEGWMHNRVRMITASFLAKDLHLPWQWGARHFMRLLADGDLAANQHGWQWVAGSGTDAAPYFRVFNPTTQGERFDPDGDYVRRYVPELAGLAGKRAHQPWKHGGAAPSYPAPIVDHDVERKDALARYEVVRGSRP